MDSRTQEFLEHVQSGGQVETADWMPDEYRSRLIKFIEMHAGSELMGVLPERDWILRAPTLQRKLALTAKIQDEVGHAQLLYPVVEDLGKPRGALTRWWPPLMQFHGNPIPADEDPSYIWRIKSQANEDARQQFLNGYVPQIWELGLTVPDSKLCRDEATGVWHYSDPDWEELRAVVTGHGPASAERIAFRALSRENVAWVRKVVLAEAA